MWETWFYSLIILFIVAVSWIVMTPIYITLSDTMTGATHFTHTSTNTSMGNIIEYNKNIWDQWPLVAAVVLFFIIFYLAEEDEPIRCPRG